jgi:hypothetical protein
MELRIEHRVVEKPDFERGYKPCIVKPRSAMGPTEAAEILFELRQKYKKRKFVIEARIIGDWRPGI